jgi:hypothetical protein
MNKTFLLTIPSTSKTVYKYRFNTLFLIVNVFQTFILTFINNKMNNIYRYMYSDKFHNCIIVPNQLIKMFDFN